MSKRPDESNKWIRHKCFKFKNVFSSLMKCFSSGFRGWVCRGGGGGEHLPQDKICNSVNDKTFTFLLDSKHSRYYKDWIA